MAKLNIVETQPPEIRIDKDVPLPPLRMPLRGSQYPFEQMKPGDSFFAPDTKTPALGSLARAWTKRRGFQRTWTVRAVEGGARIWRLT